MLLDEQGYTAGVPFYLSWEDGLLDTQLIAEAQTLGTLLNNLTAAQITQVIFGMIIPPPGSWRPAPGIGSAVSVGAMFQFSNTVNRCKYGIMIPSFLPAKLFGNRVNITDPDVVAFVGHLTSTTGTVRYTIKEGAPLNSLVSTFLNTRRHPVAQARRSLHVG